ncbi:helix-turn-helix domain-containing protein [Streptomyces sp. NPDC014734]|uniref:helix-turn-helix domain-containing protein n=1 Tax=Streptomyces sp. NPDC014734 TaxID=3364886 RepID=UPI0036F9C891
MLEQPLFGRRLRQLRLERGLSQAALAGDGMSTGYLSRLESGARHPTDRAVDHLARQLGVSSSAFEEAPADTLPQALAHVASAETEENLEALDRALNGSHNRDALRWQALWMLARWRQRHNDHGRERMYLEEMVRLGDELALPALQARGLTQLARCLRASGDTAPATDAATAAYRLAREQRLPARDVVNVLLALVSAEAETGHLTRARQHADELTGMTEGRSDALWAEALWTAAAVRAHQGDNAAAEELLLTALDGFDRAIDLRLWLRLRIAATKLHLRKSPPDLGAAKCCIDQADSALVYVGVPSFAQELTALKAELAFQKGELEEARTLVDEVRKTGPRLTYRDRVRLEILDSRLLILGGRPDVGLDRMRALAREAQQSSNIELTADIWKLLAETLAQRGEHTVS